MEEIAKHNHTPNNTNTTKNKSPTTTTSNNKKQKQKHHPTTTTTTTTTTTPSISFKPSSDVKGLKFGAQFIVKSFTVRRSRLSELPLLLNLHHLPTSPPPSFPSTITFLPTNFTILAHHAWHTLTLGLGTRKSKVIVFVFDTPSSKASLDPTWPHELPLGEVNRRLVRGMGPAWELARFKFRKGCITFYVYAVRRKGERGFQCGGDLRTILHAVDQLKDFMDHTAMLAMPDQRSINYYAAADGCNGGRHAQSRTVAAH